MKIKFPIGDWSRDGHNICDWYIIESNKSAEELRELHFSCKDELGFDIGSLCSEYEETSISIEVAKKLLEIEVLTKDGRWMKDGGYRVNDSREMLDIWLKILKYLDPSFQYFIVDDGVVTINFYGSDDQDRHLSTPGCGLFYV